MKKSPILVLDRYEGITKKAANLLSGTLASFMGYETLPVLLYSDITAETQSENTLIAVGQAASHPLLAKCAPLAGMQVPEKAEGYAIFVGKSPLAEDTDIILIAGADEAGVLYGCMDFCNKYLALLGEQGYIFKTKNYENILAKDLVPFSLSTAPAIPTRAIWTWGHMIYDYRGFFENCARLRLNEVVIWNDYCPINAKDVVNYAHSLDIKIVWGYAWGWDQSSKLAKTVAESNEEMLARIKQGAIDVYEKQYAGIGDGIYFQSFTEIEEEDVGGVNVAERVTTLVNDTARELLSRYPDLHIQFGLHATSVRTKTDIIARTDPRVYIVWEDCGAFPYSYFSSDRGGMLYSYRTDRTISFENTLALTEKLIRLRGEEECFGTVLKGLVCLDWEIFKHFSKPYIMGEHPKSFIQKRQEEKRPLWQAVTAGWLRNADLARQTLATIATAKNPITEMLVEDGIFENEIMFPVAVMAEMMWSPEIEACETLEAVAKYPFIRF